MYKMTKNKLIINFLQTTTGGGLQNAISFLQTLIDEKKYTKKIIAIVRKNTLIHEILKKNNIEYIAINDNNLHRFIFELRHRKYFKKGQVCFYPFGVAMLRSQDYLINIGGCAFSNLFYPEINFWGYLPFYKRFFKYLKDWYRKSFIKKMDYWIFETEILRRRAIEFFNFPEDRTIFINMAPSTFVSKLNTDDKIVNKYKNLFNKKFVFLYLSVAHPNKRIHLLPSIARELLNLGIDDFLFVTTMNHKHSYTRAVLLEVEKNSVVNFFMNIGPINQDQISSLLNSIDVMCNLSLLESFSNNFIEAWKMEKPLVVTNADWSRSICGDAAIYINPLDSYASAKAFSELILNPELKLKLQEEGIKKLKSFNTPLKKNLKYFEAIEHCKKIGNLNKNSRKNIFKYLSI